MSKRWQRCVVGLALLAGCAQEGDDTSSTEQAVTVCPEAVTRDDRGDPRNAAGQIRNCWPGEAHCYCDRDNDCYAQDGYVPCQPPGVDAGVRDTGPIDTGVRDTGVRDTGPIDTGAHDTGAVDTGVHDAGVLDAGPRDTGVVDVGAADTGSGTIPPSDNISYTGSIAVRTGRQTAHLTVGGETRDLTVYVPTTRAAQPPLVIGFHGTNGAGLEFFTDSGAKTMADRNGVVFIAPDSRWLSHGDWDHATEETYWETSPNVSPTANIDLMLVRAILVEARARFNVDPTRVYVIGHSSGGFFTELVATQLASRVAAFATSSAGLVRCASTLSCGFQGTGTTCAALRTQSGWCNCAGADLPGPVPATAGGRIPPAYLTHGTADPLVSVQYTCALSDRMTTDGAANTVVLREGDGHVLPETFALDAWAFLASRHLP